MNTELSPHDIANMSLQSLFSLPHCRLRIEQRAHCVKIAHNIRNRATTQCQTIIYTIGTINTHTLPLYGETITSCGPIDTDTSIVLKKVSSLLLNPYNIFARCMYKYAKVSESQIKRIKYLE